MKHLLILAAAAFLAVGCHSRTEDEAGAAPDQGDATVTATDTAAVQTDTTMGAVPEPTVTDTTAVTAEAEMGADSVGAQAEVQTTDTTAWADSAAADAPADTTAQQ